MEDIYLIVYDEESDFSLTTAPEHEIKRLITNGVSYDDMRLFKAKEIDFTVEFPGIEVKIKDA